MKKTCINKSRIIMRNRKTGKVTRSKDVFPLPVAVALSYHYNSRMDGTTYTYSTNNAEDWKVPELYKKMAMSELKFISLSSLASLTLAAMGFVISYLLCFLSLLVLTGIITKYSHAFYRMYIGSYGIKDDEVDQVIRYIEKNC